MFRRFGLNTVWARLIGLMTLIVIPIAVVIFVLAYSLYGAGLAELSASEVAAASGRASLVQDWLDEAGRALSSEAAAADFVERSRCGSLAQSFLNRNPGVSAVRFIDGTGTACAAGPEDDLGNLASTISPESMGAYGFHTLVAGARICIASAAARAGAPASLLVIDPEALRRLLRSSGDSSATRIAVIDAAGADLVLDGASSDKGWLPAAMPKSTEKHWRADDRGGRDAAFAIAPIMGSALFLLMRFDDSRRLDAKHRLVILCLAQASMLGLLALVYAGAIRRDIVRWIEGLDAAARSRGADPHSLAMAPISDNMPSELRSVAESFNAMADHVVEHQAALQSSIDENRTLMLEMHHRIKNSLQVIQSYLALIRRSAPRGEAQSLARIEARVGVIAVAYRLALTPAGMRPISVKPFLEEICGAAVGGLRRPRQRVVYAIDWDGRLVVDRAIPLGLGLVEALIVAFRVADATYIGVRLQETADGDIELNVESDADSGEILPAEKIIVGLAHQVGATFLPPTARQIAAWRFAP